MKSIKFWSIMVMFVLVLGTTLAFSSCSKDSEEEKEMETVTSTIVGYWKTTEGYYPFIFEFNEDGTGYYKEDSSSKRAHTFIYTIIKNNTIVLEMTGKDYGETESLTYSLSNDGKYLILYGFDDNDLAVMRFQKS